MLILIVSTLPLCGLMKLLLTVVPNALVPFNRINKPPALSVAAVVDAAVVDPFTVVVVVAVVVVECDGGLFSNMDTMAAASVAAAVPDPPFAAFALVADE